MHDLHGYRNTEHFAETVGALVERLTSEFVCVHAHPNNCCGEVMHAASGMNLPGAVELTLLRRDRLDAVPAESRIPPVLPHPEGIQRNVPENPPLRLNDAWISGPRSLRSRGAALPPRVRVLLAEFLLTVKRSVARTRFGSRVLRPLARRLRRHGA